MCLANRAARNIFLNVGGEATVAAFEGTIDSGLDHGGLVREHKDESCSRVVCHQKSNSQPLTC